MRFLQHFLKSDPYLAHKAAAVAYAEKNTEVLFGKNWEDCEKAKKVYTYLFNSYKE